jgi:hypothetical protein
MNLHSMLKQAQEQACNPSLRVRKDTPPVGALRQPSIDAPTADT